MDGEVAASFQDFEDGWSCIFFQNPPRLAKSRLHSLLSFLENWRHNHPMRRIEQLQVVQDKELVRGLNIFWSTFEHLVESSRIEHFTIDEEVRNLYGHEYCEALMQDVSNVAADNASPESDVAIVSRRMIVTILLRNSKRAIMCTYDRLARSLPKDVIESVQPELTQWLQTEGQGYFCFNVPTDLEI
jgi:hypothetical protein